MSATGAISREAFRFAPITARVLFGSGTRAALVEELERLDIGRALVLTTAIQADLGQAIADDLGGRFGALFTGAAMHTPVDVTETAIGVVGNSGIDGIVAIGGGSTIGLGKALALRTDLPQVVLPTTYAGSEMTPILGQTENGVKTTQSGSEIQPETVIYDIDLTMSLPVAMSITSGFNAMAHAIEALYAVEGNSVMDLLALEGIGALRDALPRIATDPGNREGREKALYGAWLCGICLGNVGMALHHKLCHTLGGAFGLPHAETHAVVLPHALAYNAPSIPSVMERLKPILGGDPARELQRLAQRLGAPTALREIGMPKEGIDRAVELALKARYPNPRPLGAEVIRDTLRRAWSGEPAAG